jgi:SAM-dependent methyltransferase
MFLTRALRKLLRVKTVFDDLGAMAVIRRVVRRVARPFTADGRAHAKWIKQQREVDAQFDAIYGTDTGGIVELFDLKIVGDNQRHGVLYAATRPDDFDRALKSLNLDFEQEYTFIDLGCGKGRTLLLASQFPFKKVVGVEFAIELAEIAKRNTLARRTTLSHIDVEIIVADAATYEFPQGPLVIYVWNAFGATVIRRVVDHVRLSWQQNPRPIFFVYMNPVHGDEFIDEYWERLSNASGCLIVTPH